MNYLRLSLMMLKYLSVHCSKIKYFWGLVKQKYNQEEVQQFIYIIYVYNVKRPVHLTCGARTIF